MTSKSGVENGDRARAAGFRHAGSRQFAGVSVTGGRGARSRAPAFTGAC